MSRCDHWNVARVRLVEISIPERGRQGRHENAVEMAIENHVERRRHAVRCGPRFDPRGDHAEFLCGSFDDISKYAADGRSAVDDGDLFAGRLF